jgi:photosystem II stability/assembly factor-like uncharacterized protein
MERDEGLRRQLRVRLGHVLRSAALLVVSLAGVGAKSYVTPSISQEATPFMGLAGLLSTTEGWGANGGGLYLTTDAGAKWTTITPENLLGEDPIARLDQFVAVGPSHLWAVISDVPGNRCQDGSCRSGAVDYSADAGRTWAVAYLPGCFDCESAASFVDPRHGFVLGQTGGTAVVYGTGDGGRSWARLGEVSAGAGTTWSGIVFTSPAKGWLVGDEPGAPTSLLYSTSDGGRTWDPTGLPEPGVGAHVVETGSLQFFGPDAVLPEVREGTAKRQDRAQIDLTTDGGASWSKLVAPPAVAASALDIDGDLTFSAASPTSWFLIAGTRLYETDDAGRSWSYTTPTAAWSAGPFQLAFIDFVSPSTGWSEVLFNSCGGLPRQTEPGSCENKVGLAATTTAGRTWRLVSSA